MEVITENLLAPTEVALDKDYGADIDVLMSLVPDRMAFKIGEISKLLGLKNYVLRYWESEFIELKPKKSHHNQRMYTRKDIEVLLMIRKFLYVDKFSISGAKKALVDMRREKREGPNIGELRALSRELRAFVKELAEFKESVLLS